MMPNTIPAPTLPVGDTSIDQFLEHCHRRRYPAKTEFIHPGDAADSLFYLVSGQVTVFIEDEDGREIVL